MVSSFQNLMVYGLNISPMITFHLFIAKTFELKFSHLFNASVEISDSKLYSGVELRPWTF